MDFIKSYSRIVRYWGRKAGNVAKILFKEIGSKDIGRKIVLDPFGGSASITWTALENNYRGIYIDINPYAYLISSVLFNGFNIKKFNKIVKKIISRKRLTYRKSNNSWGFISRKKLYSINNINVEKYFWENNFCYAVLENGSILPTSDISNEPYYYYPRDAKLYYPNGNRFDKKRNFDYIHDFFTKRNLLILSNILHDIYKFSKNDEKIMAALKLVFSSIIYMSSKMARDGAGSWGVNSYWVPKKHIELDPYVLFERKAKRLSKIFENHPSNIRVLEGPNNIQKFIRNTEYDVLLLRGDAKKLLKKFPENSIDIIITDPPHVDEIQYLELSFLINVWIDGINYDYFDGEIVLNPKQNKKLDDYIRLLQEVFIEIRRVIKRNGIGCIIFHEENDTILSKIIHTIEKTNFEIIDTYNILINQQRKIGERDTRRGNIYTIVKIKPI